MERWEHMWHDQWPHGVMTARWSTSRQMGHCSASRKLAIDDVDKSLLTSRLPGLPSAQCRTMYKCLEREPPSP
jgi:hypothetical protein